MVAEGPKPGQILVRAREVLTVVLDEGGGEWPSVSVWESRLPTWFVEACSGELSPEDAEAELARWQAMSPEEQAEALDQTRWALADWLYWLKPGERQWFWWDAMIEGEDALRVSVEVAGWPAPLGALEWLLRAAGATRVEIEDAIP